MLPNPNLTESGFRLDRYEILNWGTFDEKIWVLDPQGKTALLTGKNGSGKSTLVDGLLTLLVPNSSSRNYNQAAGGEQRRERSESSYVQGAYAQSADVDGAGKPQALKLRPDNTYTVLLAVFTNVVQQKTVTLAQMLWMNNSQFEKFYVVATQHLCISEHFQLLPNGTIRDLKARLKKIPTVSVSDTFKEYAAHIRRLFNLRSDKALNLFNQIVSIKEIGDLNDFVRKHMLEADDMRPSIDTLRGNYHDLTAAYQAIVKAENQLRQLQPLIREGENYRSYHNRIQELDQQLRILPHFFDVLALKLLDEASEQAEQEVAVQERHRLQVSDALTQQRQHERELFADLQNDDAMRRIQQLERDIKHATDRRNEKLHKAEEYHGLVRQLNLPDANNPQRFHENQRMAQQQRGEWEQRVQQSRQEQQQLSIEEDKLRTGIKELREEIDELRRRKSQMKPAQLRLREMICGELHLDETELPFIGELLQVRDAEYRWLPAIERLLNSFAREIIVPETYSRAVSAYVDRTHLNGRLIYHRIERQPEYVSDARLRPESLFHKLQIHPDTAFGNWLKERLIARFDYTCCETVVQLHREERGLTINGQIKHGQNRYEKDDRSALDDRRQYLLGWNNAEKVQALEQTFHELAARYNVLRSELEKVQKDEERSRQQIGVIDRLLNFTEYSRLDAASENDLIAQYQQEKRGLEQSSDAYRVLQQQYEQVRRNVAKTELTLRQIDSVVTTYRNALDRYRKDREHCLLRLRQVDVEALTSDFARIEKDLTEVPTLDNLDDLWRAMEATYQGSKNSLTGTLTRTRKTIEEIMRDFMRTYPQETEEVDASVESLDWYLAQVKRLENDDLPSYRERFRHLLNRSILQSINVFREQLQRREDEIRKSIEQLNESLMQIAYTTTTYIKLVTKTTQQKEISEFKQLLRNTFPDVSEDPDADNARIFNTIKSLIERFETDPRWTNLVTDVRNWLEFSAEERLISDHSLREEIYSSSGKSGGQKAKLAYTILASAIAYQYGLNEAERRDQTFRFVVIDEVFSKSDEANSRFAMDLFRQLGLQVLVVTPADKIQIVEPYIGSCHLVWNNDQGTYSQLQTITVEQLGHARLQDART